MKRDKYALYTLKGKRVSVLVPPRFTNSKRRIEGIVHHVKRDVLRNRIEIGIKKELFLFREPFQICKRGKDVLFFYGNPNVDESDSVFFDELRNVSLRGGDVNVALGNMESNETFEVCFEVIDDERYSKSSVRRGKGRRNRDASSDRGTKRSETNRKGKSPKPKCKPKRSSTKPKVKAKRASSTTKPKRKVKPATRKAKANSKGRGKGRTK